MTAGGAELFGEFFLFDNRSPTS